MALDKYLLYTAYPDSTPGFWYPEDVRLCSSLREAMQGVEHILKLGGSNPARIAIYQLVEVIREEPTEPEG